MAVRTCGQEPVRTGRRLFELSRVYVHERRCADAREVMADISGMAMLVMADRLLFHPCCGMLGMADILVVAVFVHLCCTVLSSRTKGAG